MHANLADYYDFFLPRDASYADVYLRVFLFFVVLPGVLILAARAISRQQQASSKQLDLKLMSRVGGWLICLGVATYFPVFFFSGIVGARFADLLGGLALGSVVLGIGLLICKPTLDLLRKK